MKLECLHLDVQPRVRGMCRRCYVSVWQSENRPLANARNARYRAAHPEKTKADSRARQAARRASDPLSVNEATARWAANNPEQAKAAQRKWRLRNLKQRAAQEQARRARKVSAPGAGVTAAQFSEICDVFGHACGYCLRTNVKLTLDHVEPLARGGAHDVSNVVPACGPCNSRKKDRTLLAFLEKWS